METPDRRIPRFVMLIGIPGSGKSSWLDIEKDLQYPSAEIVCPDQIRAEMSGNISDQSLNIAVWQVAKTRCISFLEKGTDVILDATNVNTKYRREFTQGLPECKKDAIFFDTHPQDACSRIAQDLALGENRADVPPEVVYRMYGEYLFTKTVIKSEGFSFNIAHYYFARKT